MIKSIAVFLFVSVCFANVQGQPAINKNIKQALAADTLFRIRLKEELGFTKIQVDSVFSIQCGYMARNRQLLNDETSSEDDRMIQLKSLEGERLLLLRTILTNYQVTKLEVLLQRLRKEYLQGGGW